MVLLGPELPPESAKKMLRVFTLKCLGAALILANRRQKVLH